MAVIVRMDIDRPYGKRNLAHKIISRVSSDLYFPRIESLGYLTDLHEILTILERYRVASYVFFRRCTFPTTRIFKMLKRGGHKVGLHLENSRSLNSFNRELERLRVYSNQEVLTFSKHGSGQHRYGLHHYAPYEPEKYISWAKTLDMKLFFGNGENPNQLGYQDGDLFVFPSAFWLEHSWRDTEFFTIDWLCEESRQRNIVLLFHPDNVMADKYLMECLLRILDQCDTKLL